MGNLIKIISAEAWVDTQPIQPTLGGTLHVVVTFDGQGAQGFLEKKIPQGINPNILLLELNFSPNRILIPNPQEVKYTEGLETSNQYSSIEIFDEENIVAEINNIPIIK